MSINIHKLWNTTSDSSEEIKIAQLFSEKLNHFLPNHANGDIYILPSMICPQGKRKDIDLVVWFDTENLFLEINSGYKENGSVNTYPTKNLVEIKSLLIAIELKSHNTVNSIRVENQKLYTKQSDGWHNTTEQSESQKVSLFSFLNNKIGISPLVNNLIWLYTTNLNYPIEGYQIPNAIWGNQGIDKILETCFKLNLPYKGNNWLTFDACRNEETRQKTTAFFDILRKNSAIGIGKISRTKINDIIVKEITQFEKSYFNEIGNKLTIFKGNPGTGKTLHLINIAHNLFKKRDLKCLILTFNKALEQDIRRLIKYITNDNQNDISILTWDGFVFRCLQNFGIYTDNDFEVRTNELLNWIKISSNISVDFAFASQFDCVLIDEGQDWNDVRKEILFKLFGHKFTVVAVGEDQEYNSISQNWVNGINKDERQSFTLDINHRNKTNIVDHYNLISNSKMFNRQLKSNNQLIGGNILISNKFDYNLQNRLVEELQYNENSFYDMMFLGGRDETLLEIELLLNNFGYKGFIANKEENKKKMFPLDEFRILSYQACRGLEGWTVVCYKFDKYLEDVHKRNIDSPQKLQDEIKRIFTIVMTRSIDTLVIILEDNSSAISEEIIQYASLLPDGRVEINLSQIL